MAPFGVNAPSFVQRMAERPAAPRLYVNSLLDSGTEEVAAFESLAGCHGAIGGWQGRAKDIVPSDLTFPTERIRDGDALHVAMVSILEHLTHRQGLDAHRVSVLGSSTWDDSAPPARTYGR